MNTELNELIKENKNLIYKLTHYFENYNNKEDLFQSGCIGLINAYYKYDPTVGAKFTTYAYPYILGEMRKYVREDKGIKISKDITKLSLKIEKANILLTQKLMREPTIEELSDFLQVPIYYINESLKSINVLQSFDEAISKDGKELTLHDTIADDKVMDINTLVALKQELEDLSKEEYDIINNRYLKDKTQSEVANIMGMSQVQVSRKEQKVLTKLKDRLES